MTPVEPIVRDRLPFLLPQFTRLCWVSPATAEVWAPRLRRIVAAWAEIEWRSVLEGLRDCCVVRISAKAPEPSVAAWHRAGLAIAVLSPTREAGDPSYVRMAGPRRPPVTSVVTGRPDAVARLAEAWAASDHETVGDLLGYPICCRRLYAVTVAESRLVDPTLAIVARSGVAHVKTRGPLQNNVLWACLGVRALPHRPCRFDCEASAEMGESLLRLGDRIGFAEETDWIREILSWPVRWSALHGICEIKTPVLKAATRTDATKSTYTLDWEGEGRAELGAAGLAFPYRVPQRSVITDSTTFRRGLRQPVRLQAVRPDWYHLDNGFSTLYGMQRFYDPIVRCASAALRGPGARVLHLECGNGALLQTIVQAVDGVEPFGVDADPTRIERAQTLMPEFASNFSVGDSMTLGGDNGRVSLVIVDVRGLGDGTARAILDCAAELRQRADRVLVYASNSESLGFLEGGLGLRLEANSGNVGLLPMS